MQCDEIEEKRNESRLCNDARAFATFFFKSLDRLNSSKVRSLSKSSPKKEREKPNQSERKNISEKKRKEQIERNIESKKKRAELKSGKCVSKSMKSK